MKLPLTTIAIILSASFSFAQTTNEVLEVSLNEDGTLSGHVFTIMENEEAPIAGKVTLTNEGKTVAVKETDATGTFSMKDIEPGTYKMIGIAGEYVGDQVIEVKPFSEASYTAVPLKVSPSFSPAAAMQDFGGAPLQTFSAGPIFSGPVTTGCVPSGYVSGGFGGGGGGIGFDGGLNFRRLALIGGAVGLAVGLSSGPSSPDE